MHSRISLASLSFRKIRDYCSSNQASDGQKIEIILCNSKLSVSLEYFLSAQCNSTYTNGKILFLGTKTAFKYSSERLRKQYRKETK